MTLPKIVRSGVMPEQPLGAGGPDPEPGDHLVEHEERAGGGAATAQPLEEPVAGGDETHVGGHRLDQHCRDLVAELLERGVDARGRR